MFSRTLYRSVLIVVMLALGTAGFAGVVSAKNSNHGAHTFFKTVHKGQLTVGSDETYPPMESQNTTTGQAVGADVDLGKAIGKILKLKVVFKNVTFDSLIPDMLTRHPFDIIMSSMNDTPARRGQGVAFVDYMKAVEAIVVNKSSKIHANGYSQMCGDSIAVESGTTEQAGLTAANSKCKKKIDIHQYPQDTLAWQAFEGGHTQAYTTDYPVAALYVKENKSKIRLAGKVIKTGQKYGIGMPKKQTGLYKAIHRALVKVYKSGQYLKILKRYNLQQGKIKIT
ncbi:MAG TPA: ABC transporter substrate-binding protein [Chloroflexota bacterium]|nr:ABC transporter substrate-binding protein [Chloroflexota bacterium]